MTPVQVDWLSIVLGPLVLVTLAIAFFTARSASKRGEPMPGWGKVLQAVGITLAMLVAVANMTWGGA
ncbi:hypothetical protein [Streptomyces sp. ME19-01-6]|uniref:hypothetical protein n=1 Tax=Streptomyces sp. ME19-01-6 TaxID=3028686 RepID=UPI0029A8F9AF|nr:hypothetical protein [Streptomyces sp. ME19-01-6]MDX3226110.1 hypothetical protein [Streptomyces sp. ME19-01-6]